MFINGWVQHTRTRTRIRFPFVIPPKRTLLAVYREDGDKKSATSFFSLSLSPLRTCVGVVVVRYCYFQGLLQERGGGGLAFRKKRFLCV